MSQEQDAKVMRVVLVGDQGVGKWDLYQWFLRRSRNVNEEVAVTMEEVHGSAPQLPVAAHVPATTPHGSAHITRQDYRRTKANLSKYPSLKYIEKPKQLLWLSSSEYGSYNYSEAPEEPSSSDTKELCRHSKTKFLRFSGLWKIGRERMEVQVTYLQPVLGNTHVLQECLESGVTVILLVYDISQYVSFQGLQEWIQNLRETKGGARRMMFLVGNRLDHERMVQVAVAQAFVKENRLSYIETCTTWDHQMEAVFSLILFRMKEMSEPLQTRNSDISLISPREDAFDEFRFQRERRSGSYELYKLEDCRGKPITWRQVIDLWKSSPEFCRVFSYTLGKSEHAAFSLETTPFSLQTLDKAFQMVLLSEPSLENVKPNKTAFQKQLQGQQPVVCFGNRAGDAILVAPTRWANDSYYIHLAAFVRNAPEYQQMMLWHTLGTAIEVRLEELGRCPLWVSTSGFGVHWIHMRLDSGPKYYRYAPFTRNERKSGFFQGIFRSRVSC